MKSRARNMARLARLGRRLTYAQAETRAEHRVRRGWLDGNHHEPVHEAKQAAPKTIAAKRAQPDRLGPPDFTALLPLAIVARAKRKAAR